MYIWIHFHANKNDIQINYFPCVLIPCKQTVSFKSTISYPFPLHANNLTMSWYIFKFHANNHAHLNQLHLMCSSSNAILLNQHLYIALLFSLKKYFTLATSQLPKKKSPLWSYCIALLIANPDKWEKSIVIDSQYPMKMWKKFFFFFFF